MRPPERFPHDDPREWMNRAKSNLARARLRVPQAYLEDLCFDAQQAAEKALKAVMMSRGIDFPYTHDIARLLAVLQVDGMTLPESMLSAARLTTYAVQARYPGLDEPVEEPEYLEAVEVAEAVVRWAEALL